MSVMRADSSDVLDVDYLDSRISALHEELKQIQRDTADDPEMRIRLIDSYGLALLVALEAKQAIARKRPS